MYNRSIDDELSQRKKDHIDLADKSITKYQELDTRFDYEPLFFSHPSDQECWPTDFLDFKLDYPLWISSMTGGTEHAAKINSHLARLCEEFKIGMGLGSCRSLLTDKKRLQEFKVKHLMPSQPLFANLGIAQVEQLLREDKVHLIQDMLSHIEADGLMILVNPLQEWFQPGGDRFLQPPMKTLELLLEKISTKIIVKEVGQGMGPRSLKALLDLPISGIELAAFGGTNFTLLEGLRGEMSQVKKPFIHVGHTALEMIDILNALNSQKKTIIISGGISQMVDAFYLKSQLKAPSLIGMAQGYLKPALNDYEHLRNYFLSLRESLLVARSLLVPKEKR